MFEDIFIETEEEDNHGPEERTIKPRAFGVSSWVPKKEAMNNGEYIAEVFDKIMRMMNIPVSVKFSFSDAMFRGEDSHWIFHVNLKDEENNE